MQVLRALLWNRAIGQLNGYCNERVQMIVPVSRERILAASREVTGRMTHCALWYAVHAVHCQHARHAPKLPPTLCRAHEHSRAWGSSARYECIRRDAGTCQPDAQGNGTPQ